MVFNQAWNRRYKRAGHVFQGRYNKSISVSGERASAPYHFHIVADYIHLNPARAKLVGGACGSLSSYRWSSLPTHIRGKGLEWLVFDRVFDAFTLANKGRGKRAYHEWLEIRATQDGGRLPDEAMRALQKGWYLGEDTFAEKLLDLLEKGAKTLKVRGSHSGPALQKHDEGAAEDVVQRALRLWDMPDGDELREGFRKGDPHKVAIAITIKRHTSVSNLWIAERLGMGRDRTVSRLIKQGKSDEIIEKLCQKLRKMLPCED